VVAHVLKFVELCDLCSQSALSFLGVVREFVVFVEKSLT
jgi:hypothetical protein